MNLFIAGGNHDFNLQALIHASEQLQRPYQAYLIPAKSSPQFHWDFTRSLPEGLNLDSKPTAAFIRQDVFAYLEDSRAQVSTRASAWYVALKGWLLSQPDIYTFNRHIDQIASYKPGALFYAQQIGLRIPSTVISTDSSLLKQLDGQQHIAKPVNGGGHCALLNDAIGNTTYDFMPSPAIVQEKLVSPEYRIFVIGRRDFTFLVDSPSLDYREKQDAKLSLVETPVAELHLLRELMSVFKMDFGAADFKTDPNTGKLVFLELNTSPMFGAFDSISQGQLCQAMVEELLNG